MGRSLDRGASRPRPQGGAGTVVEGEAVNEVSAPLQSSVQIAVRALAPWLTPSLQSVLALLDASLDVRPSALVGERLRELVESWRRELQRPLENGYHPQFLEAQSFTQLIILTVEAAVRERKAHAGALIVLPSPMFYINYRRIVDLAAKHRLPAMYAGREFVEAGGLMCYGADIPDLFHRAAAYVDRILKGAKPADLPVEQPTKFDFVINLKTAKALGLTIPQSLLIRADQVIE
jgi:hypothetical protein